MKYVFSFGEIWYYTDKSHFYSTNNFEDFQNKINELEAIEAYYYFETEKRLQY